MGSAAQCRGWAWPSLPTALLGAATVYLVLAAASYGLGIALTWHAGGMAPLDAEARRWICPALLQSCVTRFNRRAVRWLFVPS